MAYSSGTTRPGMSINDYFAMPMLSDKKTEMYVKFAKVMLIFQGPRSENRKSIVQKIERIFRQACSIISDETFGKLTSTHHIQVESTEEFYEFCRSEVLKAMQVGKMLIVIDQSTSNRLQMQFFLRLAHCANYVTLFVPPLVIEYGTDERGLSRSFSQMRSKQLAQNLVNHLFSGWFLNEVDSKELRIQSKFYIKDCIEEINDFKIMLSNFIGVKSELDEDELASKFSEYYQLDRKKQNLAYCAAKIFSNFVNTKEYFEKSKVKEAYGKLSKLLIVGFVLSPILFAARVKLTFNQKPLYEISYNLESENKEPEICPTKLFNDSKGDIPGITVPIISSKCKSSIEISQPESSDPFKNIPLGPKANAAYIILGYKEGASPKDIVYDVPCALLRESKAMNSNSDDIINHETSRSFARRIGKYWLIYLKDLIKVDSLFALSSIVEDQQENFLKK